jgi:eukaryotic-like serine/threonine-protein kinase
MIDPAHEVTLDAPFPAAVIDRTLNVERNGCVLASEPATMPMLPGYNIQFEIGRGGMGVVYKARHLALNRDVAVKMVLAGSQAGAIELVRFRQEAEAVAKLDHPNIVQVHEVGAFQGQSYLAMEYVGGGDLARKTAGVPQPSRDAARLVETLAAAAHYAHVCGILHRDLKPANVLLTSDGVPKLADFGLARRIDDTSGLTATNAILGTPGFIAPEQAAGQKTVGPAVDVYGLGAILYMLLTGRPPFQGANAVDVLRSVIDDQPVPVRRLRPDCPRDLEVICLKCLEKESGKRYASAAALADDLHRYLADEPILARPVGRLNRLRRWARRHPSVATLSGLTALLLLIISVGGVGLSLRLRSALGQSEENRLQAEGDRDSARRAETEGKEKLYQSLVSKAKAERFSRRIGQRYGTLEAVRQAVALARELDKPPAAFDELRNLAIAALALPDLKPAAEWISEPDETDWHNSYRDVDPRFQFNAATNVDGALSFRPVGTGPGDRGEIARFPGFGVEARPQWSPDGRFLAMWHWNIGRLQIWRADGLAPTLIVDETSGCRAFGFSPSGDRLITAGGGLVRVYDSTDGKITRSFPLALEVWEHIAHHPRLPQAAFGWAGGVLFMDLETGKEVGRLATASPPGHLNWHPDGELLAFVNATHVQVWEVARKRLNWTLEHRGGGLDIAFNQTGDLLVSTSWSGRMNLWNPNTGRDVFRTSGWSFCRFGSGDLLATPYLDLRKAGGGPLTQVEAGREYRTLIAGVGRSPVVRDYGGCSVHPDSRLMAVGTLQGISLMDLATGSEREFLPVPAVVVLFEPSGALLTNTRAGLFRWPVRADPADANRLRVGPPERVSAPVMPFLPRIAQSGDGMVLAASNPHAFGPDAIGAYVWRRDCPGKAIPLKPHADSRTVAVSPNGKLVATGAHGGFGLKVWDAENGHCIREFLPNTQGTMPFFSPDGRWLMNSGGQSWRVDDWTEGPRHFPGEIAFVRDMRQAACGGHKGFIPLFDTESGRELARLEDPYQDGLGWLTFSPDGTQLIGTTEDSSCVRVWDLRKIRASLKELDLDWNASAYPPEPAAQRPQPIHIELIGADKLIAPAKPAGLALSEEAWRLVTGPLELRDPAKARDLIRQALDREPGNRLYLNTLGVVEYRSGRYKEAVAVLIESLAASQSEYDAFDLYFLAMSYAKLGDAARAKGFFNRAERWVMQQMDLPAKEIEELNEIQKEAKEVLKLDTGAIPEPRGNKQ